MTITAVNPTGDNNGLDMDSEGHYTIPISYRLKSDNAQESPLVVAASVPLIYPYGDLLAFILKLDRLSVNRVANSKYHWTADVIYSSRTTDPDKAGPGKSGNTSPLSEPADISWSSGATTEIVEKDTNGDAILNSVGEAFDPPVEIQVAQPTLTVVQNESTFSGETALDYVFRVNTAPFAGAAAGKLLCTSIGATQEYQNGTTFWKVTYQFMYRESGWQKSLLNQSMIEKDGSDYVRIKDSDGQFVTEPVPIAADGTAIDRANLPASAVFLDFDVYETADFNDLDLPV